METRERGTDTEMTRDSGLGTRALGLCHDEALGAKARVLGIVAATFLAAA